MTRPQVTVASVRGAVAAAHPLAAQAGARILRAGGNAFDAAAATAAALNVVEPYMSGLAGLGLACCYVAAERRVRALDFITRVPGRFPSDRLRRRSELTIGTRSTATPGNLAGWHELVRAYGSLPFAEVLAPAIELAAGGFPLTEFNAHEISEAAIALKRRDVPYDDWACTYTNAGSVPHCGMVLRQPALARTLEAIQADGIRVFYDGPLGRVLVDRVAAHGGWLTLSDLQEVAPAWQDPAVARYRGLDVWVPPPPAEAFQLLLTLRLLEGTDLATLPANGVEHLDTVFRAIRLAAGARIVNNGVAADGVAGLVGDDAVRTLRLRLNDGTPVSGPTEQFVEPADGPPMSQHTTSLSVADRDGNIVCLTQSLGSVFGCGVVMAEQGICLNNWLSWGDVHPAGTKRMQPNGLLRQPMSPSIVTRDGTPILALGSPGSYGIPQHLAQVLVQHVDFGLDLQAAIDAPRGRLTDGTAVLVEARLSEATVNGLAERGHSVEIGPAWTRKVGGVNGVAIDRNSGSISGGCDPRRGGHVATP